MENNKKNQKPKTLNKKENIPRHSKVLTAENQEAAINSNLQKSYVAVVDDEERKSVIIFVDPKECPKPSLDNTYISIKSKCKDIGYRNVAVRKASPNIISIIYTQFYNSVSGDAKLLESESNEYKEEFYDLVQQALDLDCTDIHIEVRKNAAVVRFRVNGRMKEMQDWEVNRAEKMVSMIYMVIAKEKEIAFNMNEPQSGMIDELINGVPVRLRLNTLNAYPEGVDMVMRVLKLGMDVEDITLESLGYADDQLHEIETMTSKPNGAIIVAGVTGSGKSTTNSVLLSKIVKEHTDAEGCQIKIYTVEDPPEYEIKGVTQVPVVRSKQEAGTNPFAATMKAVLRMDPDIILVGEVRDEESVELMKHAVQSGHHVFTTVHAQHQFAILTRLRGLGLGDDVLGSQGFISGLIYQSLVKTLCPKCKIPYKQKKKNIKKESKKSQEALERVEAISKADPENLPLDNVYFNNDKGCASCASGVAGRSVAAETVSMDEELLDFIAKGDINGARNFHIQRNGKFIVDHCIEKVFSGVTDPIGAEGKVGILEPTWMLKEKNERLKKLKEEELEG